MILVGVDRVVLWVVLRESGRITITLSQGIFRHILAHVKPTLVNLGRIFHKNTKLEGILTKRVQYFGSTLMGLGKQAADDQTGVWWTQVSFDCGLAEWRCQDCGKYGFGLSIWLAQFRYWRHTRFCGREI